MINSTQQLFNIAVGGVLKQGCASVDSTGSCMYRADSGNKCAVGHVIKDEHYESAFENTALNTAIPRKQQALRNAVEQSAGHKLSDVEWNMLAKIQMAHDRDSCRATGAEFIQCFRYSVTGIAERFNLSTEVLDGYTPATDT